MDGRVRRGDLSEPEGSVRDHVTHAAMVVGGGRVTGFAGCEGDLARCIGGRMSVGTGWNMSISVRQRIRR